MKITHVLCKLYVCKMGDILHGRVDLKGLIVNPTAASLADLEEFPMGANPSDVIWGGIQRVVARW